MWRGQSQARSFYRRCRATCLFGCLYEKGVKVFEPFSYLREFPLPRLQQSRSMVPWLTGGETWLCCAALTAGWGLLPRGCCCCCSASLGLSRLPAVGSHTRCLQDQPGHAQPARSRFGALQAEGMCVGGTAWCCCLGQQGKAENCLH